MSELEVIWSDAKTACKGCRWETKESNTSTGCDLGLLEKYAQNGAEIIQAYDDDGEFNVVNGRVCHAKRERSWNGGDSPIITLRSEMRPRLSAIVLADGLGDDLEDTLRSLVGVGLHDVHLVYQQGDPKYIQDAAWEILGSRVTWRMVQYLGGDDDYYTGAMTDTGVGQCGGNWYTTLVTPQTLSESIVDRLDAALNERMERFCGVVSPRLIQVSAHKSEPIRGHLSAEYGEPEGEKVVLTSPLDKLRWLAQYQKSPWLVKESLCG